jgi:hypothetical protein
MALSHKFDPAKFSGRTAARADLPAIRTRQQAAVAQANAANSVPALRSLVAALAGDVARLIDAQG